MLANKQPSGRAKIILALYRSFSAIFVYIGILDIAGPLIFQSQNTDGFSGFNLTLGSWLLKTSPFSDHLIWLSYVLITIVGITFIILGYFSRKGYFTSLLIGSFLYLLDSIFLPFIGLNSTDFTAALIVHGTFLAVAIFAIGCFIFLYRNGLAEKHIKPQK